MKVIDLLNKIANREEIPKKIIYDDLIWEYEEDNLYYSDSVWLDGYCNISQCLNDKVEIIDDEEPQEHKIPEKIEIYNKEYDEDCKYIFDKYCQDIYISKSEEISINKINEILDYLEANND